jgi:hypothetical protein
MPLSFVWASKSKTDRRICEHWIPFVVLAGRKGECWYTKKIELISYLPYTGQTVCE